MFDNDDESYRLEEVPAPPECPCLVIRGFTCPAKKRRGLVESRCIGMDRYTRCPNFSAWFWYKVAAIQASIMAKSKKDESLGPLFDGPGND